MPLLETVRNKKDVKTKINRFNLETLKPLKTRGVPLQKGTVDVNGCKLSTEHPTEDGPRANQHRVLSVLFIVAITHIAEAPQRGSTHQLGLHLLRYPDARVEVGGGGGLVRVVELQR